jgi:cyclophilin family peptidyl-prolyl cis-trans isomerase/phage shock protein PspC (stress-responsive transcriptional regulator)
MENQQTKSNSDRIATIGLCLGIASIFLWEFSIIPILAIILGVVSLIRRKTKWKAIVGIVLGLIFFAVRINQGIDGGKDCTSFEYSNWSPCTAAGTQSRAVVKALPQNCSGGNPVLTQGCSFKPTPITNPEYLLNDATIKTSLGEIKVELYGDKMPITAGNFAKLAEAEFYNGTKFHRVIKGFMIQAGDPLTKDDTQKSVWGTGGPGYKFDDEPFAGEYTRGTLAMANSGANTNGSQFFIMHADYPLPLQYVIFGKVTSGMEVVDKIAELPVDQRDCPLTPPVIESVTVIKEASTSQETIIKQGECLQTSMVQFSATEESRMKEIILSVMQGNADMLTPVIYDEFWSIMNRHGKLCEEDIVLTKDSFAAATVCMKLFYLDALQSLNAGRAYKSDQRLDCENRTILALLPADKAAARIKANDELMLKIANKQPVETATGNVVFTKEMIESTLADMNAKLERFDKLFTQNAPPIGYEQFASENSALDEQCEKDHGPSVYKSLPDSAGGGAYCDCKPGYTLKPMMLDNGTPSSWCVKN